MTIIHNLFSYIDVVLLFSLIFVWAGRKLEFGLSVQRTGVGIVAIICLIPVSDLSVYMYPRALIGDLSMTSKALMIAWLLYRLGGPTWIDMKEIGLVMRAMVIIGIVFYPMALGLTPFDPYSSGFSASIPVIWTIVAIVYGLRHGNMILAAGILTGLWGYLFGVLESDNLFDYLFDAVLFLYAVGYSCVTFLRNLRLKKSATEA